MTRYVHPPLTVHYRDGEEWRQVLALGVRRTKHNTCLVLIMERDTGGGTENTMWVPRSRVRAADATMVCCTDPAAPRTLSDRLRSA